MMPVPCRQWLVHNTHLKHWAHDAGHRIVDCFRRDAAGIKLELQIVRIHVTRTGHLHVEALHNGWGVGGAPIRHDIAPEAQRLLEVVGQRLSILAAPLTIDLVVAAHKRADPTLDGALEGGVVDLKARALLRLRAYGSATRLLVVEDPMLGIGHDLLRLHALYSSLCKDPTQVRVLSGHILEVPSIPRHPGHTETGAQQHIGALVPELPAHASAPFPDRLLIPRGGHSETRGPRCRCPRVALRTEALRPIIHGDRRDAQALHCRHVTNEAAKRIRRRITFCRPMQHRKLLIQRHLIRQEPGTHLRLSCPVGPGSRHQCVSGDDDAHCHRCQSQQQLVGKTRHRCRCA
mmetsp:Transcript_42583/g.96043  ORF Transcript_42583/g.96043 Transcript_42583/m.96043 type:complete len:347 (+) Transcript_42583:64-1104(+)